VLTLTYEGISSDIGDAVARTLAHIGVAADATVDALPTMRRQADQRSDEWTDAYARDALATTR
jgi:LPS sulfotransferase NodH